jgi:hypothetical protein
MRTILTRKTFPQNQQGFLYNPHHADAPPRFAAAAARAAPTGSRSKPAAKAVYSAASTTRAVN